MRWRILASLVFLLLFGSPGFASGPDPNRPIRQMRHASWNETSGLSGVVYSLTQTTDGFLWVGTSTGLYRFDGLKFEPFLRSIGGPPIQEVRALLATSDGGLWVGYRNGVAFLKEDTTAFYAEEQGLPYGRVTSLARTPDGAIWAALTLSGGGKAGGGQKSLPGLARFDNGHWETIGAGWKYPTNATERVLVDGAGTLWVTGGGSVFLLPVGSKSFVTTRLHISTWNQLCLGRDRSLWLADPATHHLFHFDKSSEAGYVTVAGKTLQGIYDIHFDHNGSFWIATDRGLFRTPPGLIDQSRLVTTAEVERDQFRLNDGLSSNETNVIFEDREGNVWVGTSNGLDRFSDRSVTQIPLGHTPSDLIVGPHAQVWASQYGASPYLIPLHNSKPYLLRIWFTRTFYMDQAGTLWASMQSDPTWESRALWMDRNGTVTKIHSPPYLKGPLINGIVTDASGRLWLSISGYGEYTWKSGRWEHIPVFSGSDQDIAPDDEFVDAAGRVWLVYYARGTVVSIEGSKRSFFAPGHGLDLGNPIAGGASGGQVWIAGTNGLGFYDGKNFRNVIAVDGQHFENMSAVIPTEHDGLWLKSSIGISQIPADELESVFRDPSHLVVYRTFDGATDFVTPLAPARVSASDTGAVRSEDGKLWFAVFGGVGLIDPAHLARNDVPPPVTITALSASGRAYPTHRDLTLPKDTREVSLDYTALSLTLPERNRFRYRLIGLDTDWKDAGIRRQAFYTNLDPGTYTFKVIAANNDGVWNDTGASLTFTIPPTFVQTVWFRTLIALLFALILWVVFLIRLHHMNKQTEARLRERMIERERIARELHDTLLQGFQMLVLRFQVITDTLSPDNPATHLLEESLVRSEQALQEGRDRVSALRSEVESGNDLSMEIRRFGEDLSQASSTVFQLAVEGNPVPMQTVVHEEVLLVAREAIANAFRHARATTIKCQVIFARRHFVFVCSDNGCGIPDSILGAKKIPNHWGLTGMQERAQKIGAALHITPADPCGTRVELKLRSAIAYAKWGSSE